MGDDEYHPIKHKGSNLTSAGGIGYTVVDSIDTMIIMGLDEEYKRAKHWIEHKLSFDRDANFNTFEVCVTGSRLFHVVWRTRGLTFFIRPRSVSLVVFFLHTSLRMMRCSLIVPRN